MSLRRALLGAVNQQGAGGGGGISFVGGSTIATNEGTPVTCNLPGGYQTDDLLICQLSSYEDDPTPVHSVDTTGFGQWTQIGSTEFRDTGAWATVQSVWYKWATSGSETAPEGSCPTPGALAAVVTAFRGVDMTTPLDGVTVQQGQDTGAPQTLLCQNSDITPTTSNAWAVSALVVADDLGLTFNTSQDFTERVDQTWSTWPQGIGMATKEISAAQTAPTWDSGGPNFWAWHYFVLKPAA